MRDLLGAARSALSGRGSRPPSRATSRPTNHRPGEHGDLFACRDCGTVQQPSLPAGDDLHELYRGVDDEAYLDEEAGRRATARRLLDLIGTPRSRRPPARRGLRPRPAARRGAQPRLRGHRARAVRQLGRLRPRGPRPRRPRAARWPTSRRRRAASTCRARRRARAPRRSSRGRRAAARSCWRRAACCASSRRTRRRAPLALAGKRWWGYLPAHTYLLPRTTLRELLSARGLVISEDVPLVRSFALRYWVDGLARAQQRARRAARAAGCGAAAWAARACRCRSATSAWCSPTTCEPITPPEPRVTDRGGDQQGAHRAARLQRHAARSRSWQPRCRSTPPIARCSWTTPAPTRPPRWRCARASTCSATPPTAATAPTRRPVTPAPRSTAPTSW